MGILMVGYPTDGKRHNPQRLNEDQINLLLERLTSDPPTFYFKKLSKQELDEWKAKNPPEMDDLGADTEDGSAAEDDDDDIGDEGRREGEGEANEGDSSIAKKNRGSHRHRGNEGSKTSKMAREPKRKRKVVSTVHVWSGETDPEDENPHPVTRSRRNQDGELATNPSATPVPCGANNAVSSAPPLSNHMPLQDITYDILNANGLLDPTGSSTLISLPTAQPGTDTYMFPFITTSEAAARGSELQHPDPAVSAPVGETPSFPMVHEGTWPQLDLDQGNYGQSAQANSGLVDLMNMMMTPGGSSAYDPLDGNTDWTGDFSMV
jgi:hypothetical protein